MHTRSREFNAVRRDTPRAGVIPPQHPQYRGVATARLESDGRSKGVAVLERQGIRNGAAGSASRALRGVRERIRGRAGTYATYVMDADGGPPSRVTRTEGELEALPAWSRNGGSIYLTSSRSGSLQIWKRPLGGGEPLQLTRRGGAEALESPDGRVIYYTKVPEIGRGLWSVPADGGEE